MKTLFAALAFFCSVAVQATAYSDIQASLAEDMRKEGVQLVRNDVREPYEIKEQDVGKFLLCLSKDFKKATLYMVTEGTFSRNESTVRVLCSNGVFSFGRGYM